MLKKPPEKKKSEYIQWYKSYMIRVRTAQLLPRALLSFVFVPDFERFCVCAAVDCITGAKRQGAHYYNPERVL
eukprot:COSAG02_NODE_1453_length_12551_cov_2.557420_4_plen_73_part_00